MEITKKNKAEIMPFLISDEYINQVRTFGALGYSPERIASMLQLTGLKKASLIMRIQTKDDPYYTAYLNGKAIGEYNVDAELAKKAERGDIESITKLQERKEERDHLDLRRELLGF